MATALEMKEADGDQNSMDASHSFSHLFEEINSVIEPGKKGAIPANKREFLLSLDGALFARFSDLQKECYDLKDELQNLKTQQQQEAVSKSQSLVSPLFQNATPTTSAVSSRFHCHSSCCGSTCNSRKSGPTIDKRGGQKQKLSDAGFAANPALQAGTHVLVVDTDATHLLSPVQARQKLKEDVISKFQNSEEDKDLGIVKILSRYDGAIVLGFRDEVSKTSFKEAMEKSGKREGLNIGDCNKLWLHDLDADLNEADIMTSLTETVNSLGRKHVGLNFEMQCNEISFITSSQYRFKRLEGFKKALFRVSTRVRKLLQLEGDLIRITGNLVASAVESCFTPTLCYHCCKYGHLARDCPHRDEPGKCGTCSSNGHTMKDCPHKSEKPNDHWKCGQCGRKGHIAVHFGECPNARRAAAELEARLSSALTNYEF